MDEELNYLADYLEKISNEDDISKICKNYFKLEELEKKSKIELGIH